jgi:DUF4097 and DUF4098 domain-containing protein YvlB
MKTNLFTSSKPSVFGVALIFLAVVRASAAVEDKIAKSFHVQSGGQLVVAVDRGSIEVKTADRESVDIEITRKAGGSQTKGEKTLKDHVVTTTQDGNKVAVHAEYKGARSSGWFGGSPQLQVNYVITVPRKFDADLKTAGGSVKVAELTGKVQAQSSGGGLNFAKIEGALSGHTSGGGITVAGCRGNVDLKTSGGGLQLSEIQGDVDARTSGGSIHASKLTGRAILKSSGGGIEVFESRGQIDAGTSGGSITASLLAEPTGDCSFKTSGGGITVVLDEKIKVDVDARTSGGRVSSDLPVVTATPGEERKDVLHGQINGGGPLITAHTSGGSVRLKKP